MAVRTVQEIKAKSDNFSMKLGIIKTLCRFEKQSYRNSGTKNVTTQELNGRFNSRLHIVKGELIN